jgi:hypothetical protein
MIALLLLVAGQNPPPILVPHRNSRVCESLALLGEALPSDRSGTVANDLKLEGSSSFCDANVVEYRFTSTTNLDFDEVELEQLGALFSHAVCSSERLRKAVAAEWTIRAIVSTPSGAARTVHAACYGQPSRPRWESLLISLPTDARDVVNRIWLCKRWTRPLPSAQANDARNAKNRLRCEVLDRDRALVERNYRRRPEVLRAITLIDRIPVT